MTSWTRTLAACIILGVSLTLAFSLDKKAYNEENFPYPWALALQSQDVPCSHTGSLCQSTDQCCDDDDICLTSFKIDAIAGDQARFSTCQNMKEVLIEGRSSLKSSGQLCDDSKQCADGCCREIKAFRSKNYVCGTARDELRTYTCVQA